MLNTISPQALTSFKECYSNWLVLHGHHNDAEDRTRWVLNYILKYNEAVEIIVVNHIILRLTEFIAASNPKYSSTRVAQELIEIVMNKYSE